MSAANHFPSAHETADFIADLTDEQLFNIWSGRFALLEDPVNHRIVVRDAFKITETEKMQRVDIGKHLSEVMMTERPVLVARVADGVRGAVALAPELLAAARNEVRRNYDMPPMMEAFFEKPPFVFSGRVTAQNDTQTGVTDMKGSKSVLLDNETLSRVPKRGDSVRIERISEESGFKITPLTPGKDLTGGLTR